MFEVIFCRNNWLCFSIKLSVERLHLWKIFWEKNLCFHPGIKILLVRTFSKLPLSLIFKLMIVFNERFDFSSIMVHIKNDIPVDMGSNENPYSWNLAQNTGSRINTILLILLFHLEKKSQKTSWKQAGEPRWKSFWEAHTLYQVIHLRS